MAELNISWETVERVSRPVEKVKIVTGTTNDEKPGTDSEEAKGAKASPLLWTDKPIIVYVCDEAKGCEGFDKIEEVILKSEKVALAMRAFRRVKMHPDHADEDELTKGHGKAVPRMLFIDPKSMKVSVLEKSKLKTSTYFKTMAKTARKVYKERLDKVVDTHLDLLRAQDKLSGANDVLKAKLERLRADDVTGKRLDKVKKEVAALETKWDVVKKKLKSIWDLTPKATKKKKKA